MNMRFYIIKSGLILVSMFAILSNCVPAQAQKTNGITGIEVCRQEFAGVVKAYGALNNTGVAITYRYSLSDRPNVIEDSSLAQYRFQAGMISASFEQLDLLQNKKVSLTFNREDSIITVSNTKPGTDNSLLQLKVFDSVFLSAHVDRFEKSTSDEGLNRIRIFFKPQSFYKRYELLYNNDYLIKGLVFELADTDMDEDGNAPPPGRNKVIAISYGNYVHQEFDPSIFDEHRYVTRNAEGRWEATSLYSHCEVLTGD